jgi:hypothetical protein
VRYLSAALLAFLATNKVFSTQYVIWLLPFVPLLDRWRGGLTVIIFVLTVYLYPFHYPDLMRMQAAEVALLNLRNLLVLALLISLLFPDIRLLLRRESWAGLIPSGRAWWSRWRVGDVRAPDGRLLGGRELRG